MVSALSLALLALSASAAVAAPHSGLRYGHRKFGHHFNGHAHPSGTRNGSCPGRKTHTEYVTSVQYVSTTTAALVDSTPTVDPVVQTPGTATTAAVVTTTIPVEVVSATTPAAVVPTTQAPGNFFEPSTTLATSVVAATTQAPVVVPSELPGASSGSKKGLSYNDASLLNLFGNSGSSWAYNWGVTSGGNVPAGVEYVPMCWGRNEAPTCAQKVLDQGAKHVLSFNEPDQVGQAHMDVAEAVQLHIDHIAKPLAGKVLIGSPAVTNGEASKNMGLEYLGQFIRGCKGDCALDFLNVHWYWEASSEEDFNVRFASFITDAIALAKDSTTTQQVWITEFSNKGTTEQNVEFLNRAVKWLDSNDKVGRYAYFMVGSADGMGMVNGGTLNSVGEAYAA